MKSTLALAALALLSTPVLAQQMPKSLIGIDGQCQVLAFDGKDRTADCGKTLLQTIYADGRVGFYVVLGAEGDILTISGYDGDKPDDDTQLHNIDKVILGSAGQDPTEYTASGLCSYGNPYNGPSTVACQGTTKGGFAFLLVFRTDGTEPTITEF